jgi:5-methylcytosine-specific restriction endonuclease McrA
MAWDRVDEMRRTRNKWDRDWQPYRNGVSDGPALKISREWDGEDKRTSAIMTKPKDVTELWLRQNGWCALCHEPLDPPGTHEPDHPDAAQIDHRVPISRGGLDTLWNTQAVHRSCNIAKSDQLLGTTWVLPWFPRWRWTRNAAYAQGYEVWLQVMRRWLFHRQPNRARGGLRRVRRV